MLRESLRGARNKLPNWEIVRGGGDEAREKGCPARGGGCVVPCVGQNQGLSAAGEVGEVEVPAVDDEGTLKRGADGMRRVGYGRREVPFEVVVDCLVAVREAGRG